MRDSMGGVGCMEGIVTNVMYNDGNKLLLVPVPNKVIPPPLLTWNAFVELHSYSIIWSDCLYMPSK